MISAEYLVRSDRRPYVLQEAAASSATFINETQQCFAVKAGLSDFLDLARVAFSRATEAIHSLVDKYKTEHGLQSLKVTHLQSLVIAASRKLLDSTAIGTLITVCTAGIVFRPARFLSQHPEGWHQNKGRPRGPQPTCCFHAPA